MTWKRGAGVIAAALVLAGLAGGPGATPAARADGNDVQVAITAVTPSVWHSGDVIQVSGSVTNNKGILSGARVALWQASAPIKTLGAFDAALTAVPSDDGTNLAITTLGSLAEGASQTFAVSGIPTASQASAGGALMIGIQVLDEADVVLARARMVIGSGGPPSGALVVLLTTRPSLLKAAQRGSNPAPALFMDDHLASELQGGLGDVLKLAQQPGVTPVIDPGLFDDLTQMAAGYNVAADATAGPVPGAGQADAAAALDVINALIANGGVYRTLSGNPDLNAVAMQTQSDAIVSTAAGLPERNPLASLPLAVVQTNKSMPDGARSLIDGLSPAVVVTQALRPSATVQGNAGSAPWVAATPMEALRAIKGPAPDFSGAATVQPPLTRMARFIVADGQGDPTVVLVDNATDAATASAFMAAGWQPKPLEQVMAAPPSPFVWANGLTSPAPTPKLTSSVTRVQGYLSIWADLGDIDNAPGQAARRFLPPALSSGWNGDWDAAEAWLSQASATLAAQVGSGDVQLRVAPEWYLASANNRMPVTIVNTKGIPVQVRVHFVSENQQRLSVPDTELVVIAPGDATTVQATPQTSSNGSVQVTVCLVTSTGLQVGQCQIVQVVTTAFGRLGWMIIIGAGLAFVIATSLRVRQVRHQRSAAAASGTMEATDESSPPSVA